MESENQHEVSNQGPHLIPIEAIRAECLDGKNKPKRFHQEEYLTPIQTIRAKCLECCLGSRKEVRLCTRTICPNHPYRMGKRPKRGGAICDNSRIGTAAIQHKKEGNEALS